MEIHQERDDVRTTPVALGFLAALGLAALMVYVGWVEVKADVAASGRPVPESPAESGTPIIAGVLQTLIVADSSAAIARSAQRARLEGWGWVDERAGVIHIPIDVAIEIVVEAASR